VSVFSKPNGPLLQSSSGTLISCQYRGPDTYQVVEVTSIISVVAMIPQQLDGTLTYFLGEKIGLDITFLAGITEQLDTNELEDDGEDLGDHNPMYY
jgi:hypothetical protein